MRRGFTPLPPMRWRDLWRPTGWLMLGLGIFIAGILFGFRSIDTLFLASALTALAMLRNCGEL